jgi:predicted AlkP superfamily phosphohydrolase/phosphomutase
MRHLLTLLAAAVALCAAAPSAHAKRVVVLGFDGLDPDIVREMIDDGKLPNMARMAKDGGGLHDLGTSIPPQSPVAWSNFITGLDSGGHGIFDFLHRDPETIIPYLSTSETWGDEKEPWKFGEYVIPRGSGGHRLLRMGEPFWAKLEENGVPCMIIRMPANFPVSEQATFEISGMGTPDVRGTYGTFSYYTTDHAEFAGQNVGGGTVYNVTLRNSRIESKLEGPTNPFVTEKERAAMEFTVDVDPEEPYAVIDVDGQKTLLKEGEWSDWVAFGLPFRAMPLLGGVLAPPIPVMCRFYLKQVRPHFKLYASPLDYDPMDPKIPMAHPTSFAKEMAENTGRFYTEGMMEDTKALDEHVLTIAEFVQQGEICGNEILDGYPWVLDKYEEEFGDNGFLFYYAGNHDQMGHMMYRTMDPGHPAYDPDVHAQFAHVMPDIVERLDEMVGYTLDRLGDDTTIIVMSDHGFASWRRAMNLNSWLLQEGYLALKNPNIAKDPGFFLNVDWTRTRAYGLGLTGLYVNLRGREKRGIVSEAEVRALMEEIAYKLVKVQDPATGLQAVTKVYISEDAYHDRGHLDVGPDMIVGYAKEMRGSNQSAMGEVPGDVFIDNEAEWSADHCMDHTTVPGILISNRPLQKAAPNLQSLAAAILAEYGIGGFPGDVESLKAVGYIARTPDSPGGPAGTK